MVGCDEYDVDRDGDGYASEQSSRLMHQEQATEYSDRARKTISPHLAELSSYYPRAIASVNRGDHEVGRIL